MVRQLTGVYRTKERRLRELQEEVAEVAAALARSLTLTVHAPTRTLAESTDS